MLRWNLITPVTIFGMEVKMYRPPYEASQKISIPNLGFEFDHYAYLHLGSEIFMYKILDTNWEAYMEARGDVQAMGTSIAIPVSEKS